MNIHFRLYRSSNKEEAFDEGIVQFKIENDEHLILLDDIITRCMSDYITDTEEVKRFGIAYVDRLEILFIEITDDDKIEISEKEFMKYINTILPKIKTIWNKQMFKV